MRSAELERLDFGERYINKSGADLVEKFSSWSVFFPPLLTNFIVPEVAASAVLNAPEEILSEIERKIASGFRSIEGNYSLSTGDVVEVDGTKFLCESFGWKEI